MGRKYGRERKVGGYQVFTSRKTERDLMFRHVDFEGFRSVMPAQAGIQELQAEVVGEAA